MTWQLPDTYHLAGHGRGTATLKFYEDRDILRRSPDGPVGRGTCSVTAATAHPVEAGNLYVSPIAINVVGPATFGTVTTSGSRYHIAVHH